MPVYVFAQFICHKEVKWSKADLNSVFLLIYWLPNQGWLVGLYGISAFVGYIMANPVFFF